MRRAHPVLYLVATMPARTMPRDATAYEIRLIPARRAVIAAAWRACDGRPRDAAHDLGMSSSTLYREIRRLWTDASEAQITADLPGYRTGTGASYAIGA